MMNREMSLAEIKKCSLSILEYVDGVCKQKQINYYLAAGTLLGAVRHKGFIPWDDDIDIMIPRKDYERLIREFPSNDRYSFLTYHNTPNYPYAWGKITDLLTKKDEPLRSKYQTIGINIDVFPIDHYPNELEEAKVWCERIKKLQNRMLLICMPFAKGKTLIHTVIKNSVIAFYHFLDVIGVLSVDKLVTKLDSMAQKYNSTDSNYCGIASVSAYGVNKRNRNSVFSNTIELEFEGKKYPAPIGFDEYLKDYYDDYMELPPIEKRRTHHSYQAYWID